MPDHPAIRIARAALASARRITPLGAGAASLCLAAAGASLAQPGPAGDSGADPGSPIVPVHDEPHHRQVFQHGFVRILDLQIPPGDMSWFHTHEWPVAYMTLGFSAVRLQNLGSEWSGEPSSAGAAAPVGLPEPPETAPRATSTTSYVDEPVTHRLENVGNRLFRAMVVVNESHGDASTTSREAGFAAAPELENPWFRSYRIALDRGEATGVHEHAAPVVIFQGTAGRGVAAGPMSFELNEPGQWAYFEAGAEHEIRNLGDESIEVLEIEVRRE